MNKIAILKTWVITHKILSAIILVALLGAGYGIYSQYSSKASQAKYVIGTVKRGSLVTYITGTGQVAASEQTNITPNVSGDEITSILVKAGDEVVKGQALAYIKSGDAVKAVANAELALENSKLEYEKATKESNTQAASSDTSDLKKAYESGYNAIANAFIDLPAIFSGVSDIYYVPSRSPYFSDNNISTQGGAIAVGYKYQSGLTFDKAKREYDSVFTVYKNLSADSSPEKISAMLTSTKSILKQLLSALSGTYSTIEYVNDKYTSTPPSEITTDKTQLSNFISKVNSNSTSVENALNAIENAKDSTATSDLNMRSAELSQSKASDALRDAQVALADHTIRAPFSGLIAKVSGKVGDKASSNTAIAVIISKAKLVNITLNEIDAAKVHIGNKATLTFDALEDLKLPAHVSNIDLVGTVSQGVVSYSVEIAFDENDDRVKPGMTVNAEIIANSKDDVLLVPSSAIKTVGGKSSVQVLPTTYPQGPAMKAGVVSNVAPTNKPVTTGASNDTSVEIISGVAEGDQVVIKTVASTATTATPNILSSIGGNRNAGAGATRAITR